MLLLLVRVGLVVVVLLVVVLPLRRKGAVRLVLICVVGWARRCLLPAQEATSATPLGSVARNDGVLVALVVLLLPLLHARVARRISSLLADLVIARLPMPLLRLLPLTKGAVRVVPS